MAAVPEGDEQQQPGGEARALVAGAVEQRGDPARIGQFLDDRLRRDQRAEAAARAGDPGADGNIETLFFGKRPRRRQVFLQPEAEHILALAAMAQKLVGK